MAADVPMAHEPVPRSDDEGEEDGAFEGFDVEVEDDEGDEGDEDEDEDEDMKSQESEEPEKDETERELERLVFGDSEGFREAIKDYRQNADSDEDQSSASDEGDREVEEGALRSLQDSELFFIDSGPGDTAVSATANKQLATSSYTGDVTQNREQVAWEDSDDERMVVSLMAVPQLRKLREFDGEDVISGKDYIRRLRRQYELLHPRPSWANWDPDKKRMRKKRKRRHQRAGSIDGSATSSPSSYSEDNDESMDEGGSDEDSDMSVQPLAKLLRSTDPLTRRPDSGGQRQQQRVKLRSEVIAIERMKDIGPTQPHAITSLSMHRTLPLILSSGLSSTLYLHYLHPRPIPPDAPNPVITSLHLKHTPLTTTAFSAPSLPAGASSSPSLHEEPKIYLSARRRYFHVWDLTSGEMQKVTRIYGHQDSQRSMETLKPSPCGRYIALQGSSRRGGGGVINILDASTLQWSAQARAQGHKGLVDFCWWADGSGLSIVGSGGEVAEWSVAERRIVARWHDEGAVGTTTLCLGGGGGATPPLSSSSSSSKGAAAAEVQLGPDRYAAVGSSTGIVNLYDRHSWTLPHPTPLRTLDTLTTSITHLAFSRCGQLLAMASRAKRDALRLVHVPTATVYRNWPTSKTPLGRISALCLGEYDDSAITAPVATSDGHGGSGSSSGGGAGSSRRKSIVLCIGNEAGALRAWEITE